MRRPVDHVGQKNDFYGTKTKSFKGPFVGEAGKARAEQIASAYNKAFHLKLAITEDDCHSLI